MKRSLLFSLFAAVYAQNNALGSPGGSILSAKLASLRQLNDAPKPPVTSKPPITDRTSREYWDAIGEEKLRQVLTNGGYGRPKNVIFFLGDGMGISAVTSHRIYKAQKEKRPDIGKNHVFENFPGGGLSKTYSYDFQVTDSAAGAVGLFAGQKVDEEFLLTRAGSSKTCAEGPAAHINTGIAELAVNAGMAVGFVTTTRVTHATPAALYAKGVNRSMESDAGTKGTQCTDIAQQTLLHPANKFKVLMGGGRREFLPTTAQGKRGDGRDIKQEWLNVDPKRRYISGIEELSNLDVANTEAVLGLFSMSDFPYRTDERVNGSTVPRLKDMTNKAIKMLQKEEKGFFLMVEGGEIDFAEHDNLMHYAYEEMDEFELAIQEALSLTDDADTMIVVTADHAHALTLPGYTPQSISIIDQSPPYFQEDKLPGLSPEAMPALFFASGPGYQTPPKWTTAEAADVKFLTPSKYPMIYGAHGGDDVGVWVNGPGHKYFTGTMENTQMAYNIKYLLCLTEGLNACTNPVGK